MFQQEPVNMKEPEKNGRMSRYTIHRNRMTVILMQMKHEMTDRNQNKILQERYLHIMKSMNKCLYRIGMHGKVPQQLKKPVLLKRNIRKGIEERTKM